MLFLCWLLGQSVWTQAARTDRHASRRGESEHEHLHRSTNFEESSGSGEKLAGTENLFEAVVCNKSPPSDKGYGKALGSLVPFSRADKYKCKQLLRGGSNEWVARFSFEGEADRVIKVSKANSPSSQKDFVREATALDSLSHNEKTKLYFPELLYWFKRQSSGSIYIVTKFIDHAEDFPADADYSDKIAKQMCDAYIGAWQSGYAIGDTGSVGNRAIVKGKFHIMDVGTAIPISDKSLHPELTKGDRFLWNLRSDIDQLTIYGFRQLNGYPEKFDSFENAADFFERKSLWKQPHDAVLRQVIKWMHKKGSWCHFG